MGRPASLPRQGERGWLDGGRGAGAPYIWVYEKVNSRRCHAADIRLTDKTDYPFYSDSEVLGRWRVLDFYNTPERVEAFDPQKQNWNQEDLFLQALDFRADGKLIQISREHTAQLSWTKGLILNKNSATACGYEIRRVHGKEYLICEWKSGDYVFGGGRICWYVFTRDEP